MRLAIFSSYLSQAYVSLIGIVLMPIYLRYLGVEGIGLVGLLAMLQGLLPLLDLGLSPILARDMSRFRAGTLGGDAVWLRLRSLIRLFALLGLIVLLTVAAFRRVIVSEWLTVDALAPWEAEYCVVAMAFVAVLRWIAGVYRASLVGLEEQTRINSLACALATVRQVGVLPVLAWYSSAATTFFSYLVLAGGLELLIFRYAIGKALPQPPDRASVQGSGLREAWAMGGAMMFLTIVSILFSQLDKLILSRVLSLAEYGRFSLAVSLAGGVLLLAPPLSQVLQPRMTILASQGRLDALNDLYRTASQGAIALMAAAGGAMAVFAQPLLFAWVGDMAIARDGAPILFWYGLSNALLGVLSLAFQLQFACGDLRLHVLGNALMCAMGLPLLAAASVEFGAVGAGVALCVSRMLFLVFWVPRVHRRFLPDAGATWLLRDVTPVVAAVAGTLAILAIAVPSEPSRTAAGIFAIGGGAAALAIGLLAGDMTRKTLRIWWRQAIAR